MTVLATPVTLAAPGRTRDREMRRRSLVSGVCAGERSRSGVIGAGWVLNVFETERNRTVSEKRKGRVSAERNSGTEASSVVLNKDGNSWQLIRDDPTIVPDGMINPYWRNSTDALTWAELNTGHGPVRLVHDGGSQ